MCFSFSLKFVLTQFKFVPTEFKHPRDSNGLKIHFRILTKADSRIHSKSMFLCIFKFAYPISLSYMHDYHTDQGLGTTYVRKDVTLAKFILFKFDSSFFLSSD